MTRVFIAALTPALRAGLRALLAAPDVQVVGEASTLTGLANAVVCLCLWLPSAAFAQQPATPATPPPQQNQQRHGVEHAKYAAGYKSEAPPQILRSSDVPAKSTGDPPAL